MKRAQRIVRDMAIAQAYRYGVTDQTTLARRYGVTDQTTLARRYGLSQSQASKAIRNGRRWIALLAAIERAEAE